MTVDQRSDSLTTAGDDVHGEEVQWYNLSDGLVNELGGTVAEDREKGVLSCFFWMNGRIFFRCLASTPSASMAHCLPESSKICARRMYATNRINAIAAGYAEPLSDALFAISQNYFRSNEFSLSLSAHVLCKI